MLATWRRKQWTTRSSDPTVVVEWTYEHNGVGIKLTEFQGIVAVHINGKFVDNPRPYWADRFGKLEKDWQEKQAEAEFDAAEDYFWGTRH